MKFNLYVFSDPYYNKNNTLFYFVGLICMAIPASFLGVGGSTSYSFFLLLFLSICTIFHNKNVHSLSTLWSYRWFVAGMMVWPCCFLLQMAIFKMWNGKGFDLALRLLGCIPIFLLLSYAPTDYLKRSSAGFIIGSFFALFFGIMTVHFIPHPIYGARACAFTLNPIPFGNISLLLAFLALLSGGWQTKPSNLYLCLRVFAFSAGIYSSFLSGSRGGWLALPFLLAVGCYFIRKIKFINIRLFIGIIFTQILLTFLSSSLIQTRITELLNNIQEYSQACNSEKRKMWLLPSVNPQDTQTIDTLTPEGTLPAEGILSVEEPPLDNLTSLGQRIEMWKLSYKFFRQHPLLGIGKGQFKSAVQEQVAQQKASPMLSIYNHSHNEILHYLAEMGLLGGIALLFLYVGPLYYFLKNTSQSDAILQTGAYMGVLFVGGYIIFGLTNTMLDEVRLMGFYALMVTFLLGIIASRCRELQYISSQDIPKSYRSRVKSFLA